MNSYEDIEVINKALHRAESILSLLHFRGIVDSEMNREDVAEALTAVRGVLGVGGIYHARPMPEAEPRRRWPSWLPW